MYVPLAPSVTECDKVPKPLDKGAEVCHTISMENKGDEMKNNAQVKNWLTIDPTQSEIFVFDNYKDAWQKAEAIFANFGHIAFVEPITEVN